MLEDWNELQLEMCSDAGVKPVAVRADEKVGIARNVRSGLLPINGVRHLPENGTCGWYIWAGEMSDDPDFFVPLHVAHLEEWCEAAMPFLQFPPGWCFTTDGKRSNTWFQPTVDLTPRPPRGLVLLPTVLNPQQSALGNQILSA